MTEIDKIRDRLATVDMKVKSGVVELILKGPSFKLPQENYAEAQMSFEQMKVAEFSNSILALFGFCCAVFSSELSYGHKNSDQNIVREVLLISCSCSTVMLLLSIYWRTLCILKWERARALFSEYDGIISSNKVKILIIEVVVNLPHPLLLLSNMQFTSHNDTFDVDIDYFYNDMLTIFTIVRIYHIVRLYSVFSKYRTERAFRICNIKGRFAGTSWAVKCVMNDNPFVVVSTMMICGIFIGGYCLRIFERNLSEYSGLDFSSYANAIWCVYLTMTTVGYGDYYPSTLPGRIVGLIVCVWGVLVVSIMVFSITNLLTLSTFEEKTLSLYRKLEFREEIKRAAANMLINAYRFRQCSRKNSEDYNSCSVALARFQRSLKDFQRARLKKKILYNLNSTEDNIERRINYLIALTRRYSDNQIRLLLSLSDIIR